MRFYRISFSKACVSGRHSVCLCSFNVFICGCSVFIVHGGQGMLNVILQVAISFNFLEMGSSYRLCRHHVRKPCWRFTGRMQVVKSASGFWGGRAIHFCWICFCHHSSRFHVEFVWAGSRLAFFEMPVMVCRLPHFLFSVVLDPHLPPLPFWLRLLSVLLFFSVRLLWQ